MSSSKYSYKVIVSGEGSGEALTKAGQEGYRLREIVPPVAVVIGSTFHRYEQIFVMERSEDETPKGEDK